MVTRYVAISSVVLTVANVGPAQNYYEFTPRAMYTDGR
jgi:hypothetical protein